MPEAERALLDAILAAPILTHGSLLRVAAQQAKPGIACEFGVFTGSSLRVIRNFRKAPVFGFDSWQGLPDQWKHGAGDDYQAGHFACDMPKDLQFGVRLIPGWFADTLPAWLAKYSGPVELLHIDSDLYSSCRDVLFGLDDRIQPGTVIVFDELCSFDGTYPNWQEGEWRALHEWIATRRKVRPIARTDHQQVAFVVEV